MSCSVRAVILVIAESQQREREREAVTLSCGIQLVFCESTELNSRPAVNYPSAPAAAVR